ncbi:MAG: hypothetical protein RIQ81_550 [Pseudomonadota bacterium]
MKFFKGNFLTIVVLTSLTLIHTHLGRAEAVPDLPKTFEFEQHHYQVPNENPDAVIAALIKLTRSLEGYYTELYNTRTTIAVPLKNSAAFTRALEKEFPGGTHMMKRTDHTSLVKKAISDLKIARESLVNNYENLRQADNPQAIDRIQAQLEKDITSAESAQLVLNQQRLLVNKSFFTIAISAPEQPVGKGSEDENMAFTWMNTLTLGNLTESSRVYPEKTVSGQSILEILNPLGMIEGLID